MRCVKQYSLAHFTFNLLYSVVTMQNLNVQTTATQHNNTAILLSVDFMEVDDMFDDADLSEFVSVEDYSDY